VARGLVSGAGLWVQDATLRWIFTLCIACLPRRAEGSLGTALGGVS
jgi:hypothetical protein